MGRISKFDAMKSEIDTMQVRCDKLKVRQSDLNRSKKTLWYERKEAQINVRICESALKSVREDYDDAVLRMNREKKFYDEIIRESEEVLRRFEEIKSACAERQKELTEKVNEETQMMEDCFQKARALKSAGEDPFDDFEGGEDGEDGDSEAPSHSENELTAREYFKQAYNCRYNINDSKRKMRRISQELSDAEASKRERMPRVGTFDYSLACGLVESTEKQMKVMEESLQKAQAKEQEADANYREAVSDFKKCDDELGQLYKDLSEKRELLYTERKKDALKKAGMSSKLWKDVKVSIKPDGVTHIYYGGQECSDGQDHGHIIIDEYGQKIYDRKPTELNGNYTLAKA